MNVYAKQKQTHRYRTQLVVKKKKELAVTKGER